MRALFVCPDLRTGGAERHWAGLIPALARRGAEPALLTLAGEGDFFSEVQGAGVPALCAGMRGRFDVGGLRRARDFATGRADLVVTSAVSAQVVGHLLARRERVPHVLNEHTPCTADGDLVPLRPHQRALRRMVAPRVDRVVAVSESQVQPLTNIGYVAARIEVVPNGVFAEDVQPTASRDAVRAELGLSPDDFAALHVAGLRPEKRVDGFIAAVVTAHRSDSRVRGLVAGAGRELARVQQLTAETDGSVALLGERSDVFDLIQAADAVCLASVAEALPMAVLEGMALAKPVVATAVGGVPEAVVQGQTGYIVDPCDDDAMAQALLALAADPEHARALGEAGRVRQRAHFEGDRMADDYLSAFERAHSGR